MKRLSFIDDANASLNDGRLLARAKPGQKAKRRNLRLMKRSSFIEVANASLNDAIFLFRQRLSGKI
jgi:hypothetical protein